MIAIFLSETEQCIKKPYIDNMNFGYRMYFGNVSVDQPDSVYIFIISLIIRSVQIVKTIYVSSDKCRKSKMLQLCSKYGNRTINHATKANIQFQCLF